MSGGQEPGGLSPDEQAFFDTRGEAAPEPETTEPAAEPEAEAQAEAETQEPAAEGETEAPAKEPRHVPLSELIGERKKRQEFEQRLKESDEKWARADERMRLLTEAMQKQQQPQQEDQPSGVDELASFAPDAAREVQDLRRWQAEQQQAAQQQQQVQQLVGAYQARVQEFTQQQPDFMDAYKHVREAHARRLQIQGVPAHQVQAVVDRDELAFAATALQQGANPGERLYALAREYGYQPKAADPPPDAAAIIDAKADTVARARSLSSAGGQSSPSRVDAKALSSMSDDEFEAFMNKGGSNAFRKALNA